MANQWDLDLDDDDETESSSNGPGDLRKYAAKLKKQNAEYARQLQELTKLTRQRTIADVLAEKKFDRRIAALIPADVESTPDAVGKWLEDYGSLFGQSQPAPEAPAPVTESVDNPEFDPEVAGTMGAIAAATATATSPHGGEDLMARIMAAKTPEELTALITANGGGYGMG